MAKYLVRVQNSHIILFVSPRIIVVEAARVFIGDVKLLMR